MNSIEPTEAEITASGNDYWQALAIKKHRAREADEQAARDAKAATQSAPDWQLEPTEAMILTALAERGEVATPQGLTVCRDRLRKELREDYDRLISAMPTAADEVRQSSLAADEAQERAESVFAEKRGLLDALESSIVSFLKLHARIVTVRGLQLTDEAAQEVAFETINAKIQSLDVVSPNTSSSYEAQLRDFALRKCISPHIPAYLKPLESQANNLAKEIRDTARDEKINLVTIIKSLDHRIKHFPGNFPKGLNARLLYQLLPAA